jgi:hypothetical protein
LLRVLTGCAVAAGGLLLPQPASAAPAPAPGPVRLPLPYAAVRVAATSPAGQATSKSATADCPPGTLVAGAGIETSDIDLVLLPTEIRPHLDLTAVTVSAHAYGTAHWSVTAVAVCAPPRTTHQRVTNAVTAVAGYTKVATASCPAGTSVIGTGFNITGDATNVTVSRLVPTVVLGTVTVTATGPQLYGPTWGLAAYAVCSSASGVTRITDGPAGAVGLAAAGAGCPPGSSVNGVGAELVDDYGNPTTAGWLTEVSPDAGLDAVTAGADWWYEQGTTNEYGVCVPNDTA